MPGTRLFTYLQIGKETAAGTTVAATRMLYPDGAGMINVDRFQQYAGGNRGTRSNIVATTQAGIAVQIPYKTQSDVGLGFDEIIYMGSQIKGGATAVGAGADRTWTHAPNQTSANAQETFTLEVGDETQEFEGGYGAASAFRISADVTGHGLTQGEIDWFVRQPVKSTKTALTAVTPVKIPAYLWKVRFAASQAGLAGASDVANFLRSFALEVQTGLTPQFYMDGNAYFGQTVESMPIGGTLDLVVDSTAQAVSQFYDKAAADTVDFIQLKAIGPVLGGSFYSEAIQLAVLYEEPEIISGDVDGVNTYKVTAHIAYDPTWAQSISMVTVCSATAY